MTDVIIDGVRYVPAKEVKQPTTKYKVGDWVRVISNKSSRPDTESYLGKIFKIARVYDHGEYKREVNNELIPAYGVYKTFIVYEDELEPAEAPKEDPFDIKDGEMYYWIGYNGQLRKDFARKSDPAISAANACKDKALMEQRAMHEILNRLLWRASVQAGELDNPWNYNNDHWEIYRTCDGNFAVARSCNDKYYGIYFPTEKSALSALENIVKPYLAEHPDFVW